MYPGRGAGKAPGKGKSIADPTKDVSNSMNSQMDDGFITQGRKSRGRGGFASNKQSGTFSSSNTSQTSNEERTNWERNSSNVAVPATGNTWARRPAGRDQPRPQNEWNCRQPDFRAPAGSGQPRSDRRWADLVTPQEVGNAKGAPPVENPSGDANDTDDDDENESLDDEDDDDTEDSFSDEEEKCHDTQKQNKWCRSFFQDLDKLSVEEINDSSRQWHCAACRGGPGAIDWYKGLQPLISHAKTKRSTKVKKHRLLASLLEEELKRRGTSVIPAGEQYGKWAGLKQKDVDRDIVWPPMVVVMNTVLEKDEDDKWIGMGNQELIESFASYRPSKARHSYGPKGHRGLSLLIFDSSAVGYLDAERLHQHFIEQGTGRDAWDRPSRTLFVPGGVRQLYGFLATKEDLERFNQHCHGKSRVKYEMKSFQEMVVLPMNKMREENQQLNYYKNKVVTGKQWQEEIEKSLNVVTRKLRETTIEKDILSRRNQDILKESKDAIEAQEKFFNEQWQQDCQLLEEQEKVLFQEKLENESAKATEWTAETNEDTKRKKFVEQFLDSQQKGVKEYEAEKLALYQEYHSQKRALEEKLISGIKSLMEKYGPGTFEELSKSFS